MNVRSASRIACLFVLTGLVTLVLAAPAQGVVYSFGRHPDKERLVLQFPDGLPQYTLAREAAQALALRLPGADGAAGELPDLTGARLVSGLRAVAGGLDIELSTAEAGFVAFTLDNPPRLVVDVFSDPLGARWKPTGPPRTAPPAGPAPTAGAPAPQAQGAAPPAAARPAQGDAVSQAAAPPAAPARPAAGPEASQPAAAAPAPAPAVTPDAAVPPSASAPDAAASSEGSVPAPDTAAQDGRMRTAFEVPYVFRGRVTPPGQSAPAQAERVPGPAPAPDAAPGPAPSPAPGAAPGAAAPEALPPVAQDAVPVPGKPGTFAVGARPVAPVGAAPGAETAVEGGRPARPRPTPPPEGSQPLQRDVVERITENLLGPEGPASQFRGRVFSPGDGPPMPAPSASGPLPQPDAEVAAAPPVPEPPAPEAPAAPGTSKAPEASEAPAEPGAVAEAGADAQNATAEERARARQEQLDEIMFAARAAQGNDDHDTALKELATLLAQPDLPPDMAEDAMYTKADVLSVKYKDDLAGHFDEINGAYEAAVNHNLESWRVPAALLRRGVLNLKVGNVPEAAAFFRLLRERYQGDPNVPLTYYYWGDYYFNKGDYQKAADEFQYLVQVYPDSKFVREASLGLARALRHLGYDKQAFQIVDYIEKRWPRFYVEFPPFLRLLGDAAYTVEDYEKAKNDYWTYYNIDPKGDEADIILARLGDIYVRTKRPGAAREMYDKAVADFPDREGGLISKMRLAEEGIYDEPSVEQMFTVFDRPLNLAPAQTYEHIVAKHPDSALAPLAQLKLAMWQLWNNKNVDALAAVLDFEKKFPESALMPRARDVGLKAFGGLATQLVVDGNYPKIVSLWQEYDFVREMAADLDPQAKIALGLSLWKRGLPEEALGVVRPFLNEEQVPEHSEVAMSLALSIYADNARWEDVLGVAEVVREWELRPDFQRELLYARALALENLGRFEESRPLWVELGNDSRLAPAQRAYAIFFLAQEALAGKRLREAYEYAQDAYEMLVTMGGEEPKLRETLNILMDVTESSARYREALKWATELEALLPEGDPSWAALRYRMAGLYRRAADLPTWREMLADLAARQPDSLYGRMAASDLQLEKIEQAARGYSPPGAF
ncbi:tetratricopeptide repeat protein [Desulfocurvus vexinensis]|uniref:tetratricopeptide repeat protein n=1 Tax=Desulfocurvus vexinensis TaxID=399548 RepID=UPI0012EB7BBC|nr:tetratricopeptide repeat protein [Desulfocurvus vexinensis]